jgi:DNA polymerase-3 subunit alpha
MRTDQCTMENIAKLKNVLAANQGDSDVYLKLINGEESTMMILGEHLRVDRSGSLMGDLKATLGAGILG